MQIVSQKDGAAKLLIDSALGVSLAPPFVGLVVEDEKGVVAAFAFNGFDHQNVDMSVVVSRALAIPAIRAIARYCFDRDRLGCKRVTCLTLATNHRAINRLESLNFRLEGVLKERFPNGDALQFALLASEQKFVRLNSGLHSRGAKSLPNGCGADSVE
jgi:hypothetical protein